MGSLIGQKAMTAAERQRRRRARLRGELPRWQPAPKKRRPQFDADHPMLAGLHDIDELFEKLPVAGKV
jgi:hypothetical protein